MSVLTKGLGGGGKGRLESGTENVILFCARSQRGINSKGAPFVWVYDPEYIEIISGETTSTLTFRAKKACTVTAYLGQYNGLSIFAGQSTGDGNPTVNLTAGTQYTAQCNANSGSAGTQYGVVLVMLV